MVKITIMDKPLIVKIHEKVLLAVNSSYEFKCFNEGIEEAMRLPQMFFILGKESEENTIELHSTIEIPFNLIPNKINSGSINSDSFYLDIGCIKTRIELSNTVHPDLFPYAVLVTNDEYYDYNNAIQDILKESNLEFNIKWIFNYELNPDQSDLKLNCFYIRMDESNPLNFTFKKIGYQMEHIDINLNAKKTELNAISSSGVPDENDYIKSYNETQSEYSNFSKNLIDEIDQIILYLEKGNPDPYILRKISILVSQLKKKPTSDIEEAIFNKESEINIINIACKQWEMTTGTFNS